MPGCCRKARLTKQQQLIQQGHPEGTKPADPSRADGVTIEGILCAPCAQIARKLRDRQANCGIVSCSRKWVWKADEQIQAFAQGKPNEAPRKLWSGKDEIVYKLAATAEGLTALTGNPQASSSKVGAPSAWGGAGTP